MARNYFVLHTAYDLAVFLDSCREEMGTFLQSFGSRCEQDLAILGSRGFQLPFEVCTAIRGVQMLVAVMCVG
jgi:hypothetical protein